MKKLFENFRKFVNEKKSVKHDWSTHGHRRSDDKKEIGEVPTAKYNIKSIDVDGEKQYKLIVTGISPDQRQKLLVKKSTLKEEIEFDLDLYQMQKRAGL